MANNEEKTTKEVSVHEGHRERLKNRFLREGGNSFEPHNLLELLLFYAVPRKDTNPIAHELMKEFGSVAAVLEADVESLVQVKGISEHSAVLIKLISEFVRRYYDNSLGTNVVFKDKDSLGQYLVKRYAGITTETVLLLCLTSGGELINEFVICEGSVNSASFGVRTVIEAAVKTKASVVVLAHNHPRGTAVPSDDDIWTTRNISKAVELSGIEFYDHFVIAGNQYTGILKIANKQQEEQRLQQFLNPFAAFDLNYAEQSKKDKKKKK